MLDRHMEFLNHVKSKVSNHRSQIEIFGENQDDQNQNRPERFYFLKTGNVLNGIFIFLFDRMKIRLDTSGQQTIKRPWQSMAERQTIRCCTVPWEL